MKTHKPVYRQKWVNTAIQDQCAFCGGHRINELCVGTELGNMNTCLSCYIKDKKRAKVVELSNLIWERFLPEVYCVIWDNCEDSGQRKQQLKASEKRHTIELRELLTEKLA